eukprot:1182086-Prorocentrum_minimum.AAC.1
MALTLGPRRVVDVRTGSRQGNRTPGAHTWRAVACRKALQNCDIGLSRDVSYRGTQQVLPPKARKVLCMIRDR